MAKKAFNSASSSFFKTRMKRGPSDLEHILQLVQRATDEAVAAARAARF
jgi:hypothetical protein